MAAALPSAVKIRPVRRWLRRTATTPLVSVVIVNYRRWEETAALVDQLIHGKHIYRDRIEVIVIDNASPNSPIEDKLRGNSRVKLKRMSENRGFSAGVNAGLAESGGDWILVLNPDVILCPGFVDLLCAAALDIDEDARHGAPVGIVGFQLRNRDGSRQLSTGLFPSLPRMLLGLLKPRQTRKYFNTENNDRQRVPWVTGSCMLLRRQCIEAVGGFDEDYFLYYEDVDVCERAEKLGWSICYDPALEAVHLDPLQNRTLTSTMRAVTRHASLTYFRKHRSSWSFWGLAQIVRLEAHLRRGWFRWKKNEQDAWIAEQMLAMVTALRKDKPVLARCTLERILQAAGMKS